MSAQARTSRFRELLPPGFPTYLSDVESLLLREYGAVFVTRGGATPPPKIIFADQNDVAAFQGSVPVGSAVIGGFLMELQAPAMDALKAAIAEAERDGLTIAPRSGDSARRDYDGTVELWASRVEPALDHWTAQGRLTNQQAGHIRSLSPFEQVPVVLELEAEGIWFAKDLSKSVIYSVAPPGTSQHLAMLAFDVKEFDDPRVRSVLAKHDWFQTVVSDLPHFTYLGVAASELPESGLKSVTSGNQEFWIPDLEDGGA